MGSRNNALLACSGILPPASLVTKGHKNHKFKITKKIEKNRQNIQTKFSNRYGSGTGILTTKDTGCRSILKNRIKVDIRGYLDKTEESESLDRQTQEFM